jgi:predicted permease
VTGTNQREGAGPPRNAERFLRVLLPRSIGEEALDDLNGVYQARRARVGRVRADRWYWRQVAVFAVRLRMATWPGGVLHERSAARPRRKRMMGTLWHDLHYGVRTMLRSPGFTVIAVMTVALGIGANAAIFSVVRSVLLRPLPFPEPERLVELWEARVDRGFTNASFTRANFWDVHDQNRTLQDMGALEWTSINLTGVESPQRLSAGLVSVGFFRALGVSALVGRLFVEGEDAAGSDGRLVVLSHGLWRARFASDRSVVGRDITLDGQSYRVIGVLPPGTPWLDATDLFAPMVRAPDADRGSFELTVVARLADGVSPAAARADLQSVSQRIAAQYPEATGMGITLESGERWIASDALRRALWVLLGAVGFLLLISCVNLANLMLARTTGRLRERAVRTALGASRWRITQQALTETAMLGLFGAGLGLVLAFALVRLLRTFDPGGIPRLAEARLDGVVLGVTLLASLMTSLLTGLVPALRAPYRDVGAVLREGERAVVGHRRAGRLRNVLVSFEVTLSLILLVGAGLLVRSFDRLLNVERGFRTEHRLIFDVGLPTGRTEAERARAAQLLTELHTRIRALPQVASAAAMSMKPLRGVGTGMGYAAADKPPATAAVPWASWRLITRDYFRTMGLPILGGRDFTEQDRLGDPWRVIISQRIADQLWPGEEAVGRQFILWQGQGQQTAEVIGVAGNMRDWSLTEDPSLAVYLPYYGASSPIVNFVIHSTSPTAVLVPRLRALLADVDRNLPLSSVRSLQEMVGESVAARRFTMLLLGALAALALLLALAGVYGVLAYTVSRRRSEMGLRMALGASASSVLRLVLLQGMRPVLVGLLLGVVGALMLSRFMTSLLFGVTRLDLPTYLGVGALLLGAGALSCYLPAREALRVSALTALREE